MLKNSKQGLQWPWLFQFFWILFAFIGVSTGAVASLPVAFPQGFKWCAATAAHQIEGNNTENDWWDWEKLPGKIKNAERSGLACDHWNRVSEDIALMRWLGLKQYRMSVEWSRIQPQPGVWDHVAIEHYRREIDELELAQIEPLITLHHFTLPRWVRERGGWEWEQAPLVFADFAEKVMREIAPRVETWVTFNEPNVHLAGGYLAGLTPPGQQGNLKNLVKPLKGLLRAHAFAYHRMKTVASSSEMNHPVRIGMAHHFRIFEPKSSSNLIDRWLAKKLDEISNWAIFDALETGVLNLQFPLMVSVKEKIEGLQGTQDYVGINYYTRDHVQFVLKAPNFTEFSTPVDAPRSDMGWELYPEGLYQVVQWVSQKAPSRSILITENGIADAQDSRRIAFLETHLKELQRAIQEGARVEGYCYWSLMDNFEWIDGFYPRFGLFSIDYAANLQRTPRPSAFRYQQITRQNGL